ncbi:MAG: tetratricopeptide repeat protein [Candidatus Thiodiazotropha sp.]
MNKSPLLLTLFLTACASTAPQTPTSQETAPDIQKPAAAAPSTTSQGLTTDLVYHTLASEIAVQRGDESLAVEHALQVARESRAPEAAECATSLGLQANMYPQALSAAQLWIELAPDEIRARQIAAILYIRANQLDEAISQLEVMIRLASAQGQSGYLPAAAIAEKSGNPGQALAIMQQLVPDDSDSADAQYALALTANHAKQLDLALLYVDRSLALEAESSQGILLKTHILIAMGRKDEGIALLKQASETYPKNVQIGHAYARTLIELNQPEAALKEFEKLLALQPENGDFIFSLGIVHMQLEQYDQAKQQLKKLVHDRKKRDEAHYYLSTIAEQQDDLDSALDHYSRVEGDHLGDAQIRIAKILSDQGNLNQARDTLQRLRINQPQHQLKYFMIEAELLRESQDYETVQDIYTRALEVDPENTDLLYARGLNAADLRRVDLLEQDLRKILATQPRHADALNALGYTLADQTDRLDEAKTYILEALALKPDSPAILDSMGWVEYRQGNLQAALKYLQQAAEISPDAEIASHLGEVLWVMGERERAVEIWEEANQRDPDNRFIQPTMIRLKATD